MCDKTISILMPIYKIEARWLDAAVCAVKNQTYTNWELILIHTGLGKKDVSNYLKQIGSHQIRVYNGKKKDSMGSAANEAVKMAAGDYLLWLEPDQELTADALMEMVQYAEKTEAEIVYCDQDMVDMQGTHSMPSCRPDWSPELLLSQMYLGHTLLIKKSLWDSVEGFRIEYDAAMVYDLMLRMCEKTDKINHLAQIFHAERMLTKKNYQRPFTEELVRETELRALQDYLKRTGESDQPKVKKSQEINHYEVQYEMEQEPRVSVLIPHGEHDTYVQKTVDSIIARTDYKNYEILLLNLDSTGWSQCINQGIQRAEGEVYIILDSNVEIASHQWMHRFVHQALRPQVGVVGGLLLHEDNTIAHAGICVTAGSNEMLLYHGCKMTLSESAFVSPMVMRPVSAVSGSMMAVSKSTVEQIGGFDPSLDQTGADVEFCLRGRIHGLRTIYEPGVRAYLIGNDSEKSYVWDRSWFQTEALYEAYKKQGDPYFNPQLDLAGGMPSMRAIPPKTCDGSENFAFYDEEDTNIPEIHAYTLRKSAYDKKRINILLPSLNAEHVFGGIATALKFFEQLADQLGYARRIILVDAAPEEAVYEKYQSHYVFAECEEDCQAKWQIVPYSARAGRSLPVGEQDYFMLTGWWTSYCIQTAYEEFQRQTGIGPNVFLNFIQDFEPGFYPWSTHYLLADSTYRNEYPQIAIFNTRLLQDYFHKNDYSFYREFAFDPVLNKGLKDNLDRQGPYFHKKKQILIYGRPGTDRNAFKLIVAALRKWVSLQSDPEAWNIISAGQQHGKVYLGRGKYLKSVGKLTIDEYAEVLAESYAGISLMASPHPSYPPLEMSVFGVKVITNAFANKDLKNFNQSMISVSNISPNHIAHKLDDICQGYTEQVEKKNENPEYIDNEHVFDFIQEIKEILDGDREVSV